MASAGLDIKVAFRPVLLVSKLFGVTFFTSSKLIFIHRLFIIGLLIAILILQIPIISYWTDSKHGDLEAFLQFSKISIAWINYFINYLITVYNNNKIVATFESLNNLDLKMDDKRCRKLWCGQITHIIFNFVVICIFQVLAVHLTDENVQNLFSAPMYIFLDSLHVFVIVQFVESVLMMREFFICLNDRLSKMKKEFALSSPSLRKQHLDEVIKFRILYSTLCKFSKQWNRAFEIQLLLTLIKCFVEVTTWLANLIEIDESDYLQFLNNIIVASFHVLVILQVCYFCHVTVLENKRSSTIIFSIINSISDGEIKDELRIFSIQTLHEGLTFTVLAFFNLDLTLVREMIAAVSSYLAIIYSFDRTRNEKEK